MKITPHEDITHEAVLKEWLYWYKTIKEDHAGLFSYPLSTVGDPIAITASNLTIASLKFMEE